MASRAHPLLEGLDTRHPSFPAQLPLAAAFAAVPLTWTTAAIELAGSSVCSDVYAGKYTAPSQAVTQTAVVLTQTATDGTSTTTTAIVNVPVSSPSSSSSSGSSLSTGALAGIVVGSVAGGALLVCAMVLVYKCGRSKSKTAPPEAPAAAPPTVVPPSAPFTTKAATVPGGDHKPELPATASALGTSPPPMTQSNISEVSRNPSVLSVPTPMTPQSAVVTPPPTYPGMAVPSGTWHQYSQQPVHEVANRNVMAQADVQEVQGGWPEMAAEGPRPQELQGQHYSGNVYEMPSGHMR